MQVRCFIIITTGVAVMLRRQTKRVKSLTARSTHPNGLFGLANWNLAGISEGLG